MENFILSCLESRIENNGIIYGRFLLGPFQFGQAITVATALRRSLLSNLTGIAISGAEIEGVTHEYSSIKGVRESVLDIVLNLKKIVLTGQLSESKQVFAYLDVQGPAVVRASDIKLPKTIQCVDPNQYIATVAYDGICRMTLTIVAGKSYLIHTSSEIRKLKYVLIFINGCWMRKTDIEPEQAKRLELSNNEKWKKKIKICYILPVDAVFMPINKVNFSLEVDEQWQQRKERIIFEIWTNGSIHPRQGIYKAATSLISQFSIFRKKRSLISFFSTLSKTSPKILAKPIRRQKETLSKWFWSYAQFYIKELRTYSFEKNIYSLDIGNLDLSVQAYTSLRHGHIYTVGDLLKFSATELQFQTKMSNDFLLEIEKNLFLLGLTLRKEKSIFKW